MKQKDKKMSLHILGEVRNKIYWISRIVPGLIAIVIAQRGYSFYTDFWRRMFLYEEANVEMSKAIIDTRSYVAILDGMRGYLSGFEVAMFICAFGIVIELFYLKKKTNAYVTLVRLPKRAKYMSQIYAWPLLSALALYLIRFGFIILYVSTLSSYAGCEELVRVLIGNIWRILL